MEIVDRDLERAEVQATRTWSQSSKERRERDARRESIQSTSSGSSSSSEDMGRIATASAGSMARTRTHPIEVHRTHTHRLQHSLTVGASVKSRPTDKPLPEFGGGKPYPPPLPDQEEYVVEFDGKDDPLHPQNWPFKRKWVYHTITLMKLYLLHLLGSSLARSSHTHVSAVHSRRPSSLPLQKL